MKNSFAGTAMLLAALPLPASAALDYFLKIDDVQGESADSKHKNEIEVLSWAWGVSQGAGSTVFEPFSWQQHLDSSFVPLFLGLANDTSFESALLTARRANSKTPQDFFTMELRDAKVVSLSSTAGGDAIIVSGALSYESITMTYRRQKADGTLDAPIEGAWTLVNRRLAFSGDPGVMHGLVEAGGTLDFASTVPEPAAWLSFAAGLGILGPILRRQRQRRRAEIDAAAPR